MNLYNPLLSLGFLDFKAYNIAICMLILSTNNLRQTFLRQIGKCISQGEKPFPPNQCCLLNFILTTTKLVLIQY